MCQCPAGHAQGPTTQMATASTEVVQCTEPLKEEDSWNSSCDSEAQKQMLGIEEAIRQKIREHARISFLSRSSTPGKQSSSAVAQSVERRTERSISRTASSDESCFDPPSEPKQKPTSTTHKPNAFYSQATSVAELIGANPSKDNENLQSSDNWDSDTTKSSSIRSGRLNNHSQPTGDNGQFNEENFAYEHRNKQPYQYAKNNYRLKLNLSNCRSDASEEKDINEYKPNFSNEQNLETTELEIDDRVERGCPMFERKVEEQFVSVQPTDTDSSKAVSLKLEPIMENCLADRNQVTEVSARVCPISDQPSNGLQPAVSYEDASDHLKASPTEDEMDDLETLASIEKLGEELNDKSELPCTRCTSPTRDAILDHQAPTKLVEVAHSNIQNNAFGFHGSPVTDQTSSANVESSTPDKNLVFSKQVKQEDEALYKSSDNQAESTAINQLSEEEHLNGIRYRCTVIGDTSEDDISSDRQSSVSNVRGCIGAELRVTNDTSQKISPVCEKTTSRLQETCSDVDPQCAHVGTIQASVGPSPDAEVPCFSVENAEHEIPDNEMLMAMLQNSKSDDSVAARRLCQQNGVLLAEDANATCTLPSAKPDKSAVAGNRKMKAQHSNLMMVLRILESQCQSQEELQAARSAAEAKIQNMILQLTKVGTIGLDTGDGSDGLDSLPLAGLESQLLELKYKYEDQLDRTQQAEYLLQRTNEELLRKEKKLFELAKVAADAENEVIQLNLQLELATAEKQQITDKLTATCKVLDMQSSRIEAFRIHLHSLQERLFAELSQGNEQCTKLRQLTQDLFTVVNRDTHRTAVEPKELDGVSVSVLAHYTNNEQDTSGTSPRFDFECQYPEKRDCGTYAQAMVEDAECTFNSELDHPPSNLLLINADANAALHETARGVGDQRLETAVQTNLQNSRFLKVVFGDDGEDSWPPETEGVLQKIAGNLCKFTSSCHINSLEDYDISPKSSAKCDQLTQTYPTLIPQNFIVDDGEETDIWKMRWQLKQAEKRISTSCNFDEAHTPKRENAMYQVAPTRSDAEKHGREYPWLGNNHGSDYSGVLFHETASPEHCVNGVIAHREYPIKEKTTMLEKSYESKSVIAALPGKPDSNVHEISQGKTGDVAPNMPVVPQTHNVPTSKLNLPNTPYIPLHLCIHPSNVASHCAGCTGFNDSPNLHGDCNINKPLDYSHSQRIAWNTSYTVDRVPPNWALDYGEPEPERERCVTCNHHGNESKTDKSSESAYPGLLMHLKPALDKSILSRLEAYEATKIQKSEQDRNDLLSYDFGTQSRWCQNDSTNMILLNVERNLKKLKTPYRGPSKPDVESPEYLRYLRNKYFV
ncbi:unnamed protein product [Dicrocoelium dendriticum]|nr:unnamed protein product [Dicrocoelium dendriticum]CAH8522578.1 unnamed protein product [Dicrocoelium dendriticum]